MESRISVFIAEDQILVRSAFGHFLSGYADLAVVGYAATATEAVVFGRKLAPDVALVDLMMPGDECHRSGVDVVAALADQSPRTRCIILSAFRFPSELRAALAAGARGYLVKDTSPTDLVDAIRRVYHGGNVVDHELAARMVMAAPCPLTSREIAVLLEARSAATVNEIARALSLAEGTVRNYLSRAIGKTGARNRHEAVQIALSRGWI
jgi:two-component system response regulator DesR